MGFLFLYLAKRDRHLLKILSHHILVFVSQNEDMIQWDLGTFQKSRKPAWQLLRYSSNSNMSGLAIITLHLNTCPNREQVFGPTLALYLSLCVCLCVWTIVCVYTRLCVDGYMHVYPCICVWSVSVIVLVSYVPV